MYSIRMKRTSLLLDEHLLEELTRVNGEKTYSGAVTKATEDYLRRHRPGRIRELAGRALLEAVNRAYTDSPDPDEVALQRAMREKQRRLLEGSGDLYGRQRLPLPFRLQ
jgi:metal-responsive CopG/Arc/MetJ family transcriptional regulator